MPSALLGLVEIRESSNELLRSRDDELDFARFSAWPFAGVLNLPARSSELPIIEVRSEELNITTLEWSLDEIEKEGYK